jgi:DNA-binding transcriptional ArsR family regulator
VTTTVIDAGQDPELINMEPAVPTVPTMAMSPRIDDESLTALAETFRILGDVTRVRILDALSRAELCVQDIARQVDLSESAVSHQLRLLRGTRLVRPRRAGRQVFYTLDDHHIVKLFAQGLEHAQESRRAGGSPGRASS